MDNVLQLFNEHSRKIATAVSIALIIIMSLSVADTVLLIMETMNAPEATVRTPAATATTETRYRVSDLELFGKVQTQSKAPEVINAPETSLNLELQGVFISEDGEEESTAIIGQRNKAGELYVIGDRLPGNAVLSAVFEDHVLLRRNGRMEKLMFSDSKYRGSGTTDNPASASRANPSQLTAVQPVDRSNLRQIRDQIRGVPASPDLNRDDVSPSSAMNNYRQQLLDDPAGTLASAGITPVSEGESSGYRIGDDAPGLVKQSGLQPGDVILSVNGRPVGVATSDTALVDQVMSASRVRVEVQRGGRRFFLTVPVPR